MNGEWIAHVSYLHHHLCQERACFSTELTLLEVIKLVQDNAKSEQQICSISHAGHGIYSFDFFPFRPCGGSVFMGTVVAW